MTLIITVATRDLVFQVADTRLTRIDGKGFDDNSVKTTVVHCSDSKLLVSYTGLARIDNERTDIWLVKILNNAHVWEKTFPEATKFIESELTKAISRNKYLAEYKLAFVIAGLGINKGVRDLAAALVTNDERFVPQRRLIDHKKIEGQFGSVFFQPDPGPISFWSVYGAVDVTSEMKALRRQIEGKIVKAKTNQQLDEIMHHLVAFLRLQRKSEVVGRLISDDCTVAHLGSDYKGSLFYFSNDKKTRRYPNIVSKEHVIVDFVKK